MSLLLPAITALVAIAIFFSAYLPPKPTVQIPYDLPGFHFPLAEYALQAFQQHRFPEWDAAIYSGQSFAANPQAALFYPPMWILLAANFANPILNPIHLEILLFAHLALGAVLCYLWLVRGRNLRWEAATLGALAFVLSGYPLTQLQHLGLICGYAWFPLAFLALDSPRPFAKLTIASAMCLLAGYTPLWFVFAITVLAYAKLRPVAFAALGFSLLLCLVQLLPAAEASFLKFPELRYGVGLEDPTYLLSYVNPIPRPGHDYLYLGIPALISLLAGLLWRRPPLAAWLALAAGAIFLGNPFNLIASIVNPLPIVSELCRDWYFLAAIAAILPAFIAYGAHGLLNRFPAVPRWIPALILIATFFELRYFGVPKPFDAAAGDPRDSFESRAIPALDPAIAQLIQHSYHRILLDETAPMPAAARIYSIATPQGFDPFLTSRYSALLKQHATARTNRLFDFRLDDATLRLFGVHYLITTEYRPWYKQLLADSQRFRVIPPNNNFYRVFEYLPFEPPYSAAARVLEWTPERRLFEFTTAAPTTFHLAEQRWPGWTATINGRDTPISPWQTAFQSIQVPSAGTHRIEFRFRSMSLRLGSLLSVIAIVAFVVITRGPAISTNQNPPPPKS